MENIKFCPNCGAPVTNTARCEYCGSEFQQDSIIRTIEILPYQMEPVDLSAICLIDRYGAELLSWSDVMQRLATGFAEQFVDKQLMQLKVTPNVPGYSDQLLVQGRMVVGRPKNSVGEFISRYKQLTNT